MSEVKSAVELLLSMMHAGVDMAERLPTFPALFGSGVRYQKSIEPHVTALPDVCSARGFADIDELCIWRCAELRRGGESATIRATWKQLPSGALFVGLEVRRADGTLENVAEMVKRWTT